MTMMRSSRRAVTLIEALVVIAVGSVVFGMILYAMTSTGKATDRAVASQQMSQEALAISRNVERIMRFRVAPSNLVQEMPARGGAGAPTAAGGGATIPESVKPVLAAGTDAASSATAADRVTSGAAPKPAVPAKKLPPSVQPIMTSGTAEGGADTESTTPTAHPAAASATAPPDTDRFDVSSLRIVSLARHATGEGPVVTIDNSAGDKPRHVGTTWLQPGAAATDETPRKVLGANADKFCSDISFRYADSFDGLEPRWVTSSKAPRLVEYTVRVWPARPEYKTFEDARDKDGRAIGFTLTSAVRLP